MFQTKEQIVAAIKSGTIEHTPLEAELINKAKRLTGVDIFACLDQYDTYLSELPKRNCSKNCFVDHSYFEVYWRENSKPEDFDVFHAHMTALFSEFILNHKNEIVRPRVFLPDEQRYYGWLNTPKSQHDNSKIINPTAGDGFSEKIEVKLEAFDGLAIWHYLSDSLNALNSLDCVKKLYAKVTCGWDEKRGQMNLTVILPGAANDEIRIAITAPMLEVVKKRDKWGVITEENFDPIFKSRGSLSAEQMFNLLKD